MYPKKYLSIDSELLWITQWAVTTATTTTTKTKATKKRQKHTAPPTPAQNTIEKSKEPLRVRQEAGTGGKKSCFSGCAPRGKIVGPWPKQLHRQEVCCWARFLARVFSVRSSCDSVYRGRSPTPVVSDRRSECLIVLLRVMVCANLLICVLYCYGWWVFRINAIELQIIVNAQSEFKERMW